MMFDFDGDVAVAAVVDDIHVVDVVVAVDSAM